MGSLLLLQGMCPLALVLPLSLLSHGFRSGMQHCQGVPRKQDRDPWLWDRFQLPSWLESLHALPVTSLYHASKVYQAFARVLWDNCKRWISWFLPRRLWHRSERQDCRLGSPCPYSICWWEIVPLERGWIDEKWLNSEWRTDYEESVILHLFLVHLRHLSVTKASQEHSHQPQESQCWLQ